MFCRSTEVPQDNVDDDDDDDGDDVRCELLMLSIRPSVRPTVRSSYLSFMSVSLVACQHRRRHRYKLLN